MDQTNAKLKFTLKLKDWWGNTSVLIDAECALYKFKFDAIDALIKEKLIDSKDIDERNKVAHIKITNDSKPKDQTKFNFYQNMKTEITFNDIRINKDFVEVRLTGGVHMTIVFKKNIHDKKKEILKVLLKLFTEFSKNSE